MADKKIKEMSRSELMKEVRRLRIKNGVLRKHGFDAIEKLSSQEEDLKVMDERDKRLRAKIDELTETVGEQSRSIDSYQHELHLLQTRVESTWLPDVEIVCAREGHTCGCHGCPTDAHKKVDRIVRFRFESSGQVKYFCLDCAVNLLSHLGTAIETLKALQ